MNSSDQQIWQSLISREWNLDFVLTKLALPRTQYFGRPLLMSAAAVFAGGILTRHGRSFLLHLDEYHQLISADQVSSLIPSTHEQLKKIMSSQLTDDPAVSYLQAQFRAYDETSDRLNFGFYAFYFDHHGNFRQAIQFPDLPCFKLSLLASGGGLYRDPNYHLSWYEIRQILTRLHILVAGASVGAQAATNLLKDARLGYLTIGDPKGPNSTNFNRTTYSVFDIATAQSKAIAFARQVHEQDPTQIIFLEPTGFHSDQLSTIFAGDANQPKVDLMVEAIDNIHEKIKLLEFARQQQIPTVQVGDVGSIAEINFLNFHCHPHESLVMGLSDAKLYSTLEKDFNSAAVNFVGLSNAFKDEVFHFLRGDKNTPFGNNTPQMGSTASVAGSLATENIIRFFLNQDQTPAFVHQRLLVDKKNHRLQTQNRPPLLDYFWRFMLWQKKR